MSNRPNYRDHLPSEHYAWTHDEHKVDAAQKILLAHGITLDEFGNDKKWGNETATALKNAPPEVRQEIFAAIGYTPDGQNPITPATSAPTLGDLRAMAAQSPIVQSPSPQATTLGSMRSAAAASPITIHQPAPAASNLSSSASYASRDASGKLVAAQNPDKVGAIASPAKVVMLQGALDQIQKAGGDAAVAKFVQVHQADIHEMMSYASHNDHTYNQAARNVGQAAAKQLGLNETEFLGNINVGLKNITVGGDTVNSTYITNYTGEGRTSMRDMSAIMYHAEHQFPAVFAQNYGNQYHPDVYNNNALAFNKPGELATGDVKGVAAMASSVGVLRSGGTMAVMSDANTSATRYRDITAGTQIAIGGADPSLRQMASAAPVALPATSAQTFGTYAVDTSLPTFNWATAKQKIDCLGSTPNENCGLGTREILDSGGVHIRTADGNTVSNGKGYGPVLANSRAWTPIATGDGRTYNTASTKEAAGDPNRLVVVVMTPKAGAHLEDAEGSGHIFVVSPDGRTHSGFNQMTATGLKNPGNFTYTAYAYNGPVKNDATPAHTYASAGGRTGTHTTRVAQTTTHGMHAPHLQAPS